MELPELLYVKFICIGLAGFIVLEDFKTRLISIWALILLFIVVITMQLVELGLVFWLAQMQGSLTVYFIVIGSLITYIYFKTKNFSLSGFMGWGDVVLLFIFSLYFDVQPYLFLIICSSILGILLALIGSGKNPVKNYKVPFASAIGITYICMEAMNLSRYF